MSDFDVERITEFEIEQLKNEIWEVDSEEQISVYEQLVDALELRIQQLKDRLKNIANAVTER